MKILISFMVGMSISGTVRDRRSVPQMADGPPGMIVAPSGAVYKPEECGMDGNGDGWCAGESVPAEYFIEKEKLKKNKKVKRSLHNCIMSARQYNSQSSSQNDLRYLISDVTSLGPKI